MSEWITDRRPTEEDANSIGSVWATYNGKVFVWDYQGVGEGMAWMPITPPKPYVKPKRWFVIWSDFRQCWALRDHKTGATVCLRDDSMNVGLINSYDKDREAAERIAAIYEEVMP